MAIEMTREIFIVILISSIVGSVLSYYLPKSTWNPTKTEFFNVLINATILGLFILSYVVFGLSILGFFG